MSPEVWSEGVSNALRVHFECNQNVSGIVTEYGSNVQELKQKAARIFKMYFESSTNVSIVSGMALDFSQIWYKMMLNITFSSVDLIFLP